MTSNINVKGTQKRLCTIHVRLTLTCNVHIYIVQSTLKLLHSLPRKDLVESDGNEAHIMVVSISYPMFARKVALLVIYFLLKRVQHFSHRRQAWSAWRCTIRPSSITLTTNLTWKAFHFSSHSPQPKSHLYHGKPYFQRHRCCRSLDGGL